MNYVDALGNIDSLFENGNFVLDRWKNYATAIFPELADLCLEDSKDYDFDRDIVPVINKVCQDYSTLKTVENTLHNLIDNLEDTVQKQFQRDIEVEIVLYLGLCNGAGWVTEINGKNVVLLGIEKMIELHWCDEKHLIGLLYHELGHVFHNQYGTLKRNFESAQEQFMWQLFVEGIAMYFEQIAVADTEFFHQAAGDWKTYFDAHLTDLKQDFARDSATMDKSNQRYFGDWVSYHGYPDAGYYLGARFVQYICRYERFLDILSFGIEDVNRYYERFMTENAFYGIWKCEEEAAHIHGWDFSHIDGRYAEEGDLPWDYGEVVREYLSDEKKILDYDTGGGEFLLSPHHPYGMTAATEGYQPNVELCMEKLLPMGIDFKECSDPGAIPFADEAFDLVLNRHGDFAPDEIYRLLRPGGVFVTEQVGCDNDRDLVAMVLPDAEKPFPDQYLSLQKERFEKAGFQILRAEEAFRPIVFYDVGAFVWFARVIEWEFSDFSVDRCFDKLLKMQEILEEKGRLEGTTHRFLIVAKK